MICVCVCVEHFDWSVITDDEMIHVILHTHTQLSLLAILGSIILLFAIMGTPHTPENVAKRLGMITILIHTHTHTHNHH